MREEKLPKISVIVITYNQSNLIGRALDSILLQAEWGLKDIIICDDCSTDNNWEVISEYAKHYSEYIRAYRNESNKGIYGNLQYALSLLEDTDLIYICAGDDAICNGLFRMVIQFIQDRHVDYQNEAFTIYCDWKQIAPDGSESVFKNCLVEKYDPISLKIRHLIGNRSRISSVNVYKRFVPVPIDRGVSVAENLFDIQVQLNSDKSYYIPFIGSIYYSGIGVSLKMTGKEDLQNLADSYVLLLEKLNLSRSDQRYLHFLINRYIYYFRPGVILFFKTWYYYFTSIKFKVDIKFIVRAMGGMIIKLR